MSFQVWYKFDEYGPFVVEVQNDAVIANLLLACGLGRPPHTLQVFYPSFSDRLESLNPVPKTTSKVLPVIILSESNTKRQKTSFDLDILKVPKKISPPPLPDLPHFVCPENWKKDVELEIQTQLDEKDHDEYRVEPMAVSRCSRGGKTRTLKEIAHMNITHGNKDDAVPVIFVSFNDFSSLDEDDQENPLKALLLRIAFAASKNTQHTQDFSTQQKQFAEFRSAHNNVTENDVRSWLGDSPALLIIDELNNLSKLVGKDFKETKAMAKFIKENFLAPEGRFFMFSTHVLSTLECFGVYMEYDTTSDRNVLLQELPLVDNLSAAKTLNENLKGAREAIYYGLMPGLIHDRSRKLNTRVLVKWEAKMTQFNGKSASDRRKAFVHVLESLLHGSIRNIPTEFHSFLDATGAGGPGSERARWSPHHLEYVLNALNLNHENDSRLAKSMAGLCKSILTSKESSGDGWEALFVLFLLARCVTNSWQEPLLPAIYGCFESTDEPVVLYDAPYSSDMFYDQCQCWDQLKKGIMPGKAPAISVYYPMNAKFEAYDVVLVVSENQAIKFIIGYQLKEGKNNAKQKVENEFRHSFVLKGASPSTERVKMDWTIPTEENIDEFFGVSGKHWTPKQWRNLAATATSHKAI
ncbi:MAG: hypothetical protein SGILL_000624 [Bacillariaceae sp.]